MLRNGATSDEANGHKETSTHLERELQISLRAGEIIGEIHDALLIQYQLGGTPGSVPSGSAGVSPATITLLTQTAQAILDARAEYPDSTLADLYDDLTMPPALRRAHQANDRAVLALYGLSENATEEQIVSELFRCYNELVSHA